MEGRKEGRQERRKEKSERRKKKSGQRTMRKIKRALCHGSQENFKEEIIRIKCKT